MQVEIFKLQQEMNLATRKSVTYAFMRLPNGANVRVPVDENVAAVILASDIAENGELEQEQESSDEQNDIVLEQEDVPQDYVPQEYSAAPQTTVIEETETHRVREFGGDAPQQVEALPPAPPAAKRVGKKKASKKVQEPAPAPSALPPPAPPPPAPKSHLPEGHIVPVNTQHYKKLVSEGKITPNAFARTVPKNEYGYPILQEKEGTVDPQRVVGQHNQDEDGIGSI
jgi:hypothetical protein